MVSVQSQKRFRDDWLTEFCTNLKQSRAKAHCDCDFRALLVFATSVRYKCSPQRLTCSLDRLPEAITFNSLGFCYTPLESALTRSCFAHGEILSLCDFSL